MHAAEIFGFPGHNGAGKTTTVRLVIGVIEATSGSTGQRDNGASSAQPGGRVLAGRHP